MYGEQGHASVAGKIDELVRRQIVAPPYKHSVFTTVQIEHSLEPKTVHKNVQAAFDTMEAITVLGHWNHKKGGGVWLSGDDSVLELIPGATFIVPTGSKAYSMVGVGPGERQYLFRQFCNAGVLRWVEKVGRSDTEFEADALPEEKSAWAEHRARRGNEALKKFSRLADIYVL
ncbi:hypothetical protein C8R46DRAFT_921768 [Mycena filopes]|nr:hypothetical protein C8R46DRAFT_921768 [Mycena filopes]